MDNSDHDRTDYTSAYLEFHKSWETGMSNVLDHLNESRTSDETVLQSYERLKSLTPSLGNTPSATQIDAWGLPPKPINFPFQVVLRKKGRKASDTEDESIAKKQRTDVTTTQNKFAQLSVEDMDLTAQAGTSTSTDNGVPDTAAPPKKHHVPPITIDNVSNQAGLLKHLQSLTNLKLEAKLIATKLRIYPQAAYAYHLVRKYVNENNLESFTYILPEEKKLRLLIRGLPTDMSPVEIIGSLAEKNINVNECHIMMSKKTGKEMPLFLITLDKTEQNRVAYHVTNIGYMKGKVEALRPKYGPPQCSRCQGFFHSSRFCTRTPRCLKCAGAHLAKECTKPIEQKPKCCLCEGDHPASFLGCPRNPRNKVVQETNKPKENNINNAKPTKKVIDTPPPRNPRNKVVQETNKPKENNINNAKPTKKVIDTPPPPKVNFWEQ
ncbi:nucleic-acid-binding protein from transposon X-element [Trichonephila clavipes]|nr:nucleic-acid-binding protein from transposon X-element [Trichonephila clavipes]